jgi:hypothetical protein
VAAHGVAGRLQRAGVRDAEDAERGVVGLPPFDATDDVDAVGQRVVGRHRVDAVDGVIDFVGGGVQAALQPRRVLRGDADTQGCS